MREPVRPPAPSDVPTGVALRIEWSQTRALRVVRISGHIDQDTKHHFDNALIGLGGRDLLIDLTEVESSPDVDMSLLLARLKKRLGPRSLILEGVEHWICELPSGHSVLGEAQPEAMGENHVL